MTFRYPLKMPMGILEAKKVNEYMETENQQTQELSSCGVLKDRIIINVIFH